LVLGQKSQNQKIFTLPREESGVAYKTQYRYLPLRYVTVLINLLTIGICYIRKLIKNTIIRSFFASNNTLLGDSSHLADSL